jgi:hypothetical protein
MKEVQFPSAQTFRGFREAQYVCQVRMRKRKRISSPNHMM